jgi:hypothetical protein
VWEGNMMRRRGRLLYSPRNKGTQAGLKAGRASWQQRGIQKSDHLEARSFIIVIALTNTSDIPAPLLSLSYLSYHLGPGLSCHPHRVIHQYSKYISSRSHRMLRDFPLALFGVHLQKGCATGLYINRLSSGAWREPSMMRFAGLNVQ